MPTETIRPAPCIQKTGFCVCSPASRVRFPAGCERGALASWPYLAVAAFIASATADFAGFINVITPGNDPATEGDLDELGEETSEDIEESTEETAENIQEAQAATEDKLNETQAVISEGFIEMKQWMQSGMRNSAGLIAAPVESAIDETLAFYEGITDPRVAEAVHRLNSGATARALRLFHHITRDYAEQKDAAAAAEAWRAYATLSRPVA